MTRLFGRVATSVVAPWIQKLVLRVDSRPINRFRRERGLAARRNIWDIWRGDLNLMADMPEYAPTAGLPDKFHYVDPIIWKPETPAPEWLASLDLDRVTMQ